MTEAVLYLKRISSDFFEECRIASFVFTKEVYTPYTVLNASFYPDNADYSDISEIKLAVRGKTVHHGLVDSLEFSDKNGCPVVRIESRGFTSLLAQNQLEPGLKTGISFNSLIDDYYTFPYVTHEDVSASDGYIYVKYGSSIWDGAVNLTYKTNGGYPYIHGTNCVMMNPVESPVYFTYGENEIIETGMTLSGKKMLSHLHMSDIDGEYGTFELSDNEAAERNYIRHHFFELDKQFLYDPQQALEYRMNFAKRANLRYFCVYNGYKGEDLCDVTAFGSEVKGARICGISIRGGYDGISTEISVYCDDFCNRQ